MSRGIACDFWGAVLGERGWWLLALSVLSCAHADRFEADMLVLAAAEPVLAAAEPALAAAEPAPSLCV